MRFGLPVSFLLHGGILAWALITLERTPPFKPPEPEPVEVAIISEDGLTRLRQGDRNAKQLEAAPAPPAPDSKAVKEPPKPKPPEPKAPPPPAEEVKVEPPKPEPPKPDPITEKLAMLPPEPVGPTPEEVARLEAEKKAADDKKRQDAAKKAADEKKKRDDLKKKQDEAKRLADLKKRQEEAKKAAEPDDFEAEMQKALKDNDPTKRTPPPPGGTQQALGKKGPTAGAPEGRDTQLTASQGALLGSLIKQAVSKCWNINSGVEGIDKIVVKLEVHLRPDGRLVQPPRVVNSMPGPLFADTANSAMRAVVQCEPYNFPQELYKGGWDQAIWTFDPRRMF